MQLFLFLFALQDMKRPTLQNKQLVLLQIAFRARNVLGTFEKRAPGPKEEFLAMRLSKLVLFLANFPL